MAKSKGSKKTKRSTGTAGRKQAQTSQGRKKKSPSARKSAAKRRAAARGTTRGARKSTRKSTEKAAPGRSRAKAAPKRTSAKASPKRAARPKRAAAPKRSAKASPKRPAPPKRASAKRPAPPKRASAKAGGTGRERELAQTPKTGRTVKGRTNPMRTIRSTGTGAGAGDTRRAPGLERERKQLRELEETIPEPPSSLNMDRHGSAVRTGRAEMRQARREHTETSPALTGGDVDADWEDAYAVGDEAPGGDNPTPDQDRVDDIGRALGIEYQDNEELKAADKVAERDKHRWELDPASAEDYREHDRDAEE